MPDMMPFSTLPAATLPGQTCRAEIPRGASDASRTLSARTQSLVSGLTAAAHAAGLREKLRQ